MKKGTLTPFLTPFLPLPPLVLGQCSLVRRHGKPVAFVSWAFLDAEAEGCMRTPPLRLRPADWIIDVVAPFSGAELVLKEIKDKAFKDRLLKALQPAPDGNGVAVVEW